MGVNSTEIDDLSTLHSEDIALYQYVRKLLSLKSLIKEVIENLGIDSEKLKFVSSSTVYKNNNGFIFLEKSKYESYIKSHFRKILLV